MATSLVIPQSLIKLCALHDGVRVLDEALPPDINQCSLERNGHWRGCNLFRVGTSLYNQVCLFVAMPYAPLRIAWGS